MRFRRRAKLFPGVYLNFSKSGISTTIGGRGASINFSNKGTYLNTSIPGTGIYDRQRLDGGNQNNPVPANAQEEILSVEDAGAIKSENAESTTTEGLLELKNTLMACYQERLELKNEILKSKTKLTFATILLILSYVLIFGFFIKWFRLNRSEISESLHDLTKQLENCFINIDMNVDVAIENQYKQLLTDYKEMLSSKKIWDITSTAAVDQRTTRSSASTAINRRQVKFGFGNIDIIKSKFDALHFENANGGDLFIYPAFVAIVDAHKKFGLVDIRDLIFYFQEQRFVEEQKVPTDAKVVEYTWAKVNKNGSPDKRFKGNYQIPVCLYGEFSLISNTGLNEAYSISSFDKSEKFARSMTEYQKLLK